MKNAIIIGASSGIGYELAIQMANQGYRLGLMARRQELLVELSDRLPGEHFVQVTDLLDADMARTQLATLIEKMGDVELIVVNSGVGASEKILDWTIESEMIDVNVRGFTAMSMDAMNHFVQRGGGHLVGVSSVAAHFSGGLSLTYNATKAFVSNYLNGMRSRASRSGLPITITTVEPGFIDTPMLESKPIGTVPVEKAVSQMVKAILGKKNHVYITHRWVIVAGLFYILPNWLIRKFV
ncbi:SDR family NAD(P)-dependent oxidoreductase [Gammaproteobacteria bacterium]|nr:SDR family NAD(P)-dependent oxidoreductase [Gammaproteobacteria bacterium]|tara:strand:+ start:1890 stop:2606 length:717 start_codon:yes stop_codon:yes gene_type:complete